MRIDGHFIHRGMYGLGDTAPCVVGATDANGNTIAYCPPAPGAPAPAVCPAGIAVTAGACVCPAGTTGAMDPTGQYMTCGSPQAGMTPASTVAAPAASVNWQPFIMYGAMGLGALLLISAFTGGRRR